MSNTRFLSPPTPLQFRYPSCALSLPPCSGPQRSEPTWEELLGRR